MKRRAINKLMIAGSMLPIIQSTQGVGESEDKLGLEGPLDFLVGIKNSIFDTWQLNSNAGDADLIKIKYSADHVFPLVGGLIRVKNKFLIVENRSYVKHNRTVETMLYEIEVGPVRHDMVDAAEKIFSTIPDFQSLTGGGDLENNPQFPKPILVQVQIKGAKMTEIDTIKNKLNDREITWMKLVRDFAMVAFSE